MPLQNQPREIAYESNSSSLFSLLLDCCDYLDRREKTYHNCTRLSSLNRVMVVKISEIFTLVQPLSCIHFALDNCARFLWEEQAWPNAKQMSHRCWKFYYTRKKVLPPYIWTRRIVYVSYAFVQMYSQPHVIDYEKRYFLLGIIKLKAKENTVKWPRPCYS